MSEDTNLCIKDMFEPALPTEHKDKYIYLFDVKWNAYRDGSVDFVFNLCNNKSSLDEHIRIMAPKIFI